MNPSKAADEVISLCDKDANGLLSAGELAACPGLLSAVTSYDANADKQLSRDEIAAHIAELYAGGTGLTTLTCRVLFGGRPLRGADVRFVPEPFLGPNVKPAEGDTDGSGLAAIGVADSELPQKARGAKLMQLGVYRVEITHPTIKIPAKFNTQTTLGFELNPGTPDEPAVFRLQSK